MIVSIHAYLEKSSSKRERVKYENFEYEVQVFIVNLV